MHVILDDIENIVYLWGYDSQYLIAEIRNATYTDVVKAIQGGEPTIAFLSSSINPDMSKVNALRAALPGAMITTYTHKPLVGVLSATDPQLTETVYNYDFIGRLNRITQNGKVVNEYNYNYKNK